MIRIDFEYGSLSVDAALIVEGLRIDAKLRAQDARGKITSVCERGVDRDAGCRILLSLMRKRSRSTCGAARLR
jgi:hypothetical protein